MFSSFLFYLISLVYLFYQLFIEPEWALGQEPIRPSASWAIDSEAMRARGIIVLVRSN